MRLQVHRIVGDYKYCVGLLVRLPVPCRMRLQVLLGLVRLQVLCSIVSEITSNV